MHLVVLLIALTAAAGPTPGQVQTTIKELLHLIQNEQATRDTKYHFPVKGGWAQEKGIYESTVHFYFAGDEEHTLARELIAVPDDNMFVTAWLCEMLLDAEVNGALDVDDDSLTIAVDAILAHRDRNRDDKCPIFGFWNQIYNGVAWHGAPPNLVGLLGEEEGIAGWLEKVLNDLGLHKIAQEIDILGVFLPEIFLKAMGIPPDADDTAASVALGSFLSRVRNTHPTPWQHWEQATTPDLNCLVDRLLKSSYVPDSDDTSSWIDPRTYLWLHPWLNKHKGEGMALFGTWLQTWAEDKQMFPANVSMPYNVNNIDPTVNANVVYGLISALITEDTDSGWFAGKEIQTLTIWATRLVAYTIESRIFEQRPDIILLYYPPTYNLYFFAARSLFLLDNAPDVVAKYPVLKEIHSLLQTALMANGTEHILTKAECDDDFCHVDDFMGNGDVDRHGNPKPRYEDRIYSTAVCLSSLLDTWTVSAGSKRQWVKNVPSKVKYLSENFASFLAEQATGKHYKPNNCFFSASEKGGDTPFSYPQSLTMYLSGQHVDPHTAKEEDESPDLCPIIAGLVNETIYDQWLTETWFEEKVPLVFDGYNSPGFVFVYWNSPAFTYAVSVNALAKWSVVG